MLLEEILEKEADDKTAKDKLSAQEMRQKAMERMSQKKMTMVLRRKRPGEAHKNSSSFLKKKCPKPMLIKRKNFKSS